MRKLLLLSNYLGAVCDILKTNKTIAFIPTAGDTYENPCFVTEAKERLIDFGYKVIDVPVAKLSKEEIEAKINISDAIFIAGGNTHYLLQEMQKKNIISTIKEQVDNGMLYIGTSAGAVMAMNDISYISAMVKTEQAPDLKDTKGLALFDKYIIPHADNQRYTSLVQEIASKLPETILLNDNQALYVEQNDTTQIIKPIISNK